MSDIVQLYSDKSKTKKAYPKTLASETYMSSGGTVESQLAQIENKNIDQDIRLKEVERVNKVQDVYVRGLFNENKDGRLSVEGEGNSLKLEGSKEGLVEVGRIVGDTTVNISPKMDGKWYINNYIAYYSNKMDTSLFKPNTEFTIIIYNAPNTLLNSLLDGITTFGSTGTIYKFTSKSSFSNNCYFHIYKKNAEPWTSDELKDCKFAILEGDYTNKPIPSEVFEGLQSSFEENLVTQEMINEGLESEENLGKYKVPVRIVGKNKFDKGSSYIVPSGIGHTYLPIQYVKNPTNQHTISIESYKNQVTNGTWTSQIGFMYTDGTTKMMYVNNNKSLTSTSGKTIDYVFVRDPWFTETIFYNLQLEEGTVATDYQEYFERTTNVYLNSPLLEGDEIVMKDVELCHYHKRGIELLNGNKQILQTGTGTLSTYAIYEDSKVKEAQNQDDIFLICDKLVVKPQIDGSTSAIVNEETFALFSRVPGKQGYYISIPNIYLNSYDYVGINQWLQQNPVTVVYELSEPYYEPIQADKLLLECANDSTLHIESIVPVESVKASYKGNVPSVYGLEETGITNTEDISVTQTAVDFLLMSSMGEVMMMSFNENTRGGNNMGAYFASRIMKGALKYEDVIRKYPEFKDDIDFILRSEGYEHLIVEIQ